MQRVLTLADFWQTAHAGRRERHAMSRLCGVAQSASRGNQRKPEQTGNPARLVTEGGGAA